jgi:hypothetical protein
VSAGSEAEDEHAGLAVAKAGDRACPVFMVLVGAATGLADAGAVLAQTRTEFAGDDRTANGVLTRSCGRKLTERPGRRDQRPGRRDPWRGRRARRVAD